MLREAVCWGTSQAFPCEEPEKVTSRNEAAAPLMGPRTGGTGQAGVQPALTQVQIPNE